MIPPIMRTWNRRKIFLFLCVWVLCDVTPTLVTNTSFRPFALKYDIYGKYENWVTSTEKSLLWGSMRF